MSYTRIFFDNNADSEDYLEDSLAAEVLEDVEDSSSLDDDELSSMPEPMTEETTTRSVVFESNELDMDNTDSDTSYTNSGTSNINSAANLELLQIQHPRLQDCRKQVQYQSRRRKNTNFHQLNY